MTEAHDYVLEVRALGEQGLQVELYYPELGRAQQELSIRHADGLAAADRMVLYRETVRAVARGSGLWASLAPKAVPTRPATAPTCTCRSGAVLLGGVAGIRRGLDPGSPLMVDPANLTDAERDAWGIVRLPESLGGPLDALERDELLAAALGEPRLRAYLAVPRSETVPTRSATCGCCSTTRPSRRCWSTPASAARRPRSRKSSG